MCKKIWRIRNLKYVAAFLLPMIFTLFYVNSLDNDSWFLLAEGREIVDNGVYYVDALTIHEGLNIVVQQYGFAAIFWLVYSVAGPAGLYIMMLILNFLVCYFIYKICMLLSNKNTNLSLIIMVAADLVLSFEGFVVTRPQMVSYVIMLVAIYVLELYVKTNKMKYLWIIPVLSLLQINLHASLWWMILLVMLTYVVDSIKKPRLHLQGYRTWPLIVVGVVAFLAGMINPYGIKMITFIFTSYGVNEIFSLVNEMKAFNMRTNDNILLYIVIVGVLMLYIFAKSRKIRMRYVLMFFGFLALGLNSVKGMSQLILIMFLPLALLYKDIRIDKLIDDKLGREALIMWSGVVATCVTVALLAVVVPRLENAPGLDSVEGMDVIDMLVEEDGLDKKDLKVYAGYDDGGYVEFRGYKSYLDPRAEVFIKKNNGKDDILKEWEDLIEGQLDVDSFLSKYDFDYLFVGDYEEPLYKMKRDDYELVYKNSDESGIRVFRHIR